MKRGFFKRFLTILLATILMVTSLPISTFANENLKAQDTSFNEFIARDVEVGGETRTSKEAENVAVEFLSQLGSGKSKRVFYDEEIIDLEQVYPEEVSQRALFSSDDAPELFIFNNANSGFVIVSGDKRATDILGYSDEGSFNYDDAPEYVKDWIGEYENQIQYIRNNPEEFADVIDEKVLLRDEDGAVSQTVAPFLNDIKWDQLDPYNLLAPEYAAGKKSATGCVATAMAQVMKYYNYPTQGVKDTSYDWRNPHTGEVTNLSSDISNHTYDWDNMPKSYIGVTDETQRQNVAQLMYDAGVAAKMEYGESSGTASLYAGQAFVENFGFDEGLKDLYRSSYSKEDWQNIVREELIEKRPVFYGGSGKSGGHQFILDGYDDNNLYHVNWGWGGMANGYYALDAMNPTSLGTGAAGGTYNMHQEILVGIKPKDENIADKTIRAENTGKLLSYSEKPEEVADLNNGPYTTSKSQILISTWNLFVESLSGFQGEVGLGLEINGEVKLFQKGNSMEVGQYASSQFIIWQNLGYVTDGDYELKMYKKATGETSFSEIPSKTNKSDVIKVRLEGNNVTYYLDEQDNVSLELIDFSRDPGWELYSGSTAKFNANIKNNGNEEYNSLIYIELENKMSGQKYTIGESQIVLSSGETKTINIHDDITYGGNPIPSGEYTAKIIYNKGNTQDEIATGSYEYLGNGIDVEIKEKVLGQMNILENPRFVENTNPKIVSKPSDLNIVVKIKAIGGLVEGSFSAVVAEYGASNEIMNFSSETFRLENGMEQDIILENSDISQLVDGKDYLIYMFNNGQQMLEVSPLPFTYKKVETIDKSELVSKITEAEKIDKTKYTAETVKTLEEALANAKDINGNDNATQEEVNNAVTALDNAIKSLKGKPVVDKSALQTKYDAVKDKAKDNYTDDSWNAFTVARDAAKDALDKTDATQDDVNTALENLTTAITNLKVKVDKTALASKIEEAEGKKKEDYTEETFNALEGALANAKTVLDDADVTQNEVDNAAIILDNAINGLKTKPVVPTVNKDALQAKYDKIKDKAKDNYTDDSWNAFVTARDAANTVLENDNATQDDVNTALANLNTAVDGLVEKEPEPTVDKSALQTKYDEVKDKAKDNYTDDSWNTFEIARDAANTVLENDNATQAEVNNALSDLNTAVDGLVENQPEPMVDKSELQAKYDEVKDKAKDNYTDDSWNAFETARDNANTVLENDDVTQAEVDTTLSDLNTAIVNLVEENQLEPTVDKSKLSEKISEAEKIDDTKYTSGSVANLRDALERAKIVLNDLSASQAEVDTALRNLNSAIKSLNLKEDREESSSGSSSSGSWNWAPSKATKEVSKDTVISKEAASTNDFKDIDNHWAKDIIKYVVEKGYFNGVDKYNFAPNQKATRGEFITVLGRLAKADVSKYQISKAKDLNKGAFYEPYANWAFEVGIVNGYEDGTFRGEDNISREEMAVLLYNTLKYMKVDLGESSNELFKDQDKISNWAIESVNILKAGEFIKGKEDNRFDPKSNLTRAEIAQIIYNVIQK